MTKEANTSQETSRNGRRSFLSTLAMIIGIVAAYGTGAFYALKFLLPKKKETSYRQLLVGALNDIPVNVARPFKDLAGRENILVNTGNGLKAISTTCTHLGCKVHWEGNKNRFFCPCHNAAFDPNGNVLSGPPPRPLDTYDVVVDENENVFVMVKES